MALAILKFVRSTTLAGHALVLATLLVVQLDLAAAQTNGVQYPIDVAVAPDGTVYVADLNLPGIWRFQNGKRQLYFQGQKKFRTPLNRVRCLAVDGQGRLLAGDSSTWEVYRFDANGRPQPLANGKIGKPMGIAVGKDGSIYVSDLEVHRIWKLAQGKDPEEIATVAAPMGMAIDGQQRLWIVSRGKHQLRRLTPDGKLEIVVRGQPFQFPHDVCLTEDGTAIVSDGYGKCLWKVAPGEKPQQWVRSPSFDNPVGLAYHNGKVYVADSRAKMVFVVDAEGKVTPLWQGE